ncbi:MULTISPECIES: S9 family peptidase [unclassified Nocardia]|uniref:alpha/beta hydrolase family protein n=1 Tax=unclassified Nocardia TaxID=2637762 RepID=UPI001CE401DC|nr:MULTISPECIES: alpha/beta fold hydrolase [unclassified Nocardia]
MLRSSGFGFAVVGAIVLLGGPVACSTHDSTAPGGRGAMVSTIPLTQLSTEQTAAYLAEAVRTKPDTPVRNGVDAYRVVYKTVNPDGSPTTATGLVVLPRTNSHRLRVVSYEHGTMSARKDAPSVSALNGPDRACAIMFAAAGYAVVAPDYLGLGEGPGPHPYVHVPTETSASIDLLRAARTLTEQQQRELDPDVLVTGASQGGTAATCLAKALVGGQAPGFGLAALAPVSGPYDLQHVDVPAGPSGRIDSRVAVFYFSYWITAMNRIYHFYDEPSEAFQRPYATTVESLFDGQHDEREIGNSLPGTLQELLTPQFIDRLLHPAGSVLKAMTDSDGTCDWTPQVPVHLYHSTGDRDVPYANAEACLRAFHSDKVTLTNLGDTDHETTIRLALPRILDQFLQEVPAT